MAQILHRTVIPITRNTIPLTYTVNSPFQNQSWVIIHQGANELSANFAADSHQVVKTRQKFGSSIGQTLLLFVLEKADTLSFHDALYPHAEPNQATISITLKWWEPKALCSCQLTPAQQNNHKAKVIRFYNRTNPLAPPTLSLAQISLDITKGNNCHQEYKEHTDIPG